MYKYLLQSMEGVEWFGIVSLLLFVATFLAAAAWALFARKEEVQRMANLPLNDD